MAFRPLDPVLGAAGLGDRPGRRPGRPVDPRRPRGPARRRRAAPVRAGRHGRRTAGRRPDRGPGPARPAGGGRRRGLRGARLASRPARRQRGEGRRHVHVHRIDPTRHLDVDHGHRRPRPPRGSPRPTEVIETTATVNSGSGATAPDARDPGADSALRKAGRTTGAAAAAGRRAVDGHRPQVEDAVRRAIRGAGRLAGKLAGPKEPTEAPPGHPPMPTGPDRFRIRGVGR